MWSVALLAYFCEHVRYVAGAPQLVYVEQIAYEKHWNQKCHESSMTWKVPGVLQVPMSNALAA